MNIIEKREDGLYWPKNSGQCYDWTYTELDGYNVISENCVEKRTIIHAGGNVGVYARKYATIFNNVYVFEPEVNNFKCLSLNTQEFDNIYLYRSALGNKNYPIELNNSSDGNCGTFSISGRGSIPQLKIDDLGLSDVDCIHLDVEGFEPFALMGAIETIERCSPLIVVEWLEHGSKFGWNNDRLLALMSSMGYNSMKNVCSDMMFKKV